MGPTSTLCQVQRGSARCLPVFASSGRRGGIAAEGAFCFHTDRLFGREIITEKSRFGVIGRFDSVLKPGYVVPALTLRKSVCLHPVLPYLSRGDGQQVGRVA
jgi:hypothetical protein